MEETCNGGVWVPLAGRLLGGGSPKSSAPGRDAARAHPFLFGVGMIRRIEVKGVKRTQLRLRQHRARARVALQRNAPYVRTRLIALTLKNFASESDDGRPWVPLKPDYAVRKAGPQMLVETAEMLQSLIQRTRHSVYKVTPGRIVWGTSDPKAKYHNHYNFGTIPPGRPFMPRPKVAEPAITRRLKAFILGHVTPRPR